MVAYIKDKKTFVTVAYADIVEYTVPLLSYDNSKGTVVFADRVVEGNEGNWLILDGNPFVIESIQPSDTLITVSVTDAINAFNRKHRFPTTYANEGALLAALFSLNYKSQSDTEYAMPYLNVTNTDASAIIPADMDGILFSMSDYLRKVVQRGIKIDFTVTNTTLDITISTRSATPKNIFANDGNTEVVAEEFSRNVTAKVTTIQGNTTATYYLQADGSISQTAPSPRISGDWQLIEVGENDSTLEKATEVFAANDAAYKIEFYSFNRYEVGQSYKMRIRDNVHDVVVSFIEISDKDKRYHYKAGALATTLSEKLKLILK